MVGMSLPWTMAGPLEVTDDDRDGSRATLTVRRFMEHRVPVDVNFETSARNTTYHISVPSSSTVTSASITVQGM
ncbi:MAG: hypothetical protein GWN18_01740, partial [Thermoplasmata archaeon]|nr:hypothetical protein [Thermoplasmata archaeon]NIW81309.1 hypothetical protein [Thermoplasmata archaeon]